MNAVILCARMSSERLPGKALVAFAGKTALQHIIERFQSCRRVDRVIVATSSDKADDAIERVCGVQGVPCYRGSLTNVVERMDGALNAHAPDAAYVFRGLGDMPLFDTALLDWRFDLLVRRGSDVAWCGLPDDPLPVYGSRESPWSRRAWDLIVQHSKGRDLEHPGQALYSNLPRYRVSYTEMLPAEYYAPVRLELDTPDDLVFFRALFEALHAGPGTPTTLEALRWLAAHPDVAAINAEVDTKTLTSVGWHKRKGLLWLCPTCNAFPMQVNGLTDRPPKRLVTRCPRCGATRDFSELPPHGPEGERYKDP